RRSTTELQNQPETDARREAGICVFGVCGPAAASLGTYGLNVGSFQRPALSPEARTPHVLAPCKKPDDQ
ncbi:hypothetical protein, partial [Sinorhizobium fredii]|uniref:hypothetical protein n=1 Tax=Rhizobium fredii TaxID=380 RepID=UPI001AEC2316